MAIVRIMETSETTQMEVTQKTEAENQLQLEISLTYFTQYSCKAATIVMATIVMAI